MSLEEVDWNVFDECENSLVSPTSSPELNTADDENFNLKCKYCTSVEFISVNAELCCKMCGAIPDIIPQHTEEKSYAISSSSGGTKNSSRMGMPSNPLLPTSSLGSSISSRGHYNRSVQKMCKYHKWNSMPYKERSLWTVYSNIQTRAEMGGISNLLITDAKSIYKQLSEVSISRGANRKGLIAACVYISCKRNNVPRSAKEIAKMFDLKVSQLTKGAKKLMNILNANKININNTHREITAPVDFVERFCSELDFNNEYIMLCKQLANRTSNLGIVESNTPPSIASGCIFLLISLLGLNISKKTISQVCKISEVTIGKCYKKLLPYVDELITKEERLHFNI